MPKLWKETVQAHRRDVRETILDTTASLVSQHGLRSVTMAQIAERTGIGRATLYKYFPDVEAILVAWHDRHVTGHLHQLTTARDAATDPGTRPHAVLAAYAHVVYGMAQQHHGTELSALVHRDEHVARAQRRVHDLVRDVLTEAANMGEIRGDVTSDELATYCVHALAAAASLPSTDAVDRLVTVILAGLRPDTTQAANGTRPSAAATGVAEENSAGER